LLPETEAYDNNVSEHTSTQGNLPGTEHIQVYMNE